MRRLLPWALPAALFLYLAWASSASSMRIFWPGGDDAFITFIYARNVAEGHGLVYNPADAEPTEGYSSPLHVLTLALAQRLGADLYPTALALGIGLFLLIPVCVGAAVASALGVPPPRALAAALTLHLAYLFPAATALHLNSGMETLPFMAVVAAVACWTLAETCAPGRPEVIQPVRLAAGAAVLILAALARPEGAFFALCSLAALAWARGGSPRRPAVLADRTVLAVAGAFLAFLGVYLAWKLWYFGYLLPNPYYVKSQHSLLAGRRVLLPGVKETVAFAAAFGPAIVVGAGVLLLFRPVRERWRMLAAVVGPGALLIALYARFVHEVAFGHRFEYPFLASFQVALTAGLALALGDRGLRRLLPFGAAALVLLIHVLRVVHPGRDALGWTRIRTATMGSSIGFRQGTDLQRTGLGQRATLLTGAAGEVPFRSRFRTIDTLGLNTNRLSGRTPMTLRQVWEFIDRQRPDVLVSVLPPAAPPEVPTALDPVRRTRVFQAACTPGFVSELSRTWDGGRLLEMVSYEMRYIRDHYRLGAAYRLKDDPFPMWTFLYVRRDSPHRGALMHTLRASRYADRTTDLAEHLGNDPRRL